MAKRFGGFTPDQLGRIVPEMAGMQSDEQAKFLAANPAAAARVGAMTERARKMVEQPVQMATGGVVAPSQSALQTAQDAEAAALKKLQDARIAQAADPSNTTLVEAIKKAEVDVTNAQEGTRTALDAYKLETAPTTAELMATASNQPSQLTTKADVASMTPAQKAAGEIATGTGQLTGAAPAATLTPAQVAQGITQPTVTPAATVQPTTIASNVDAVVQTLQAATGLPGPQALAQAQNMSPYQLAQLGIGPAQLQQAVQVQAPAARTVQAGEMIAGPTVDMQRVATETNFAAATGVPSTEATVQGQLTKLMSDFEGKDPPPWAAGALRAATAAMAQRGVVASSMAGQAIVQAAMESALPIAQADAATRASFEAQNLSNRQQAALFAAQQRANFLGIEFDQGFQARVQNAARIADIANLNFTAEQQVALENARLAQSVDLANLNNQQAKIMADAAAMSQLDLTNLNNRQQTAVQNAQSFLQMDMANLNNEQQNAMFQAQSRIQSLFSDQAAENAAAQFNATNENQTNQFFANLSAQVSQFNADQRNAMERFNAGEANAIAQFNANVVNQREQFNAANSLIIEQANAQWYQNVATLDNAAINQANRDAAAQSNAMTQLSFNAYMQETRDLMSYAFQSADNDATRATNLAIAKMAQDSSITIANAQLQASQAQASASKSAGLWGAIGSVAAAFVRKGF